MLIPECIYPQLAFIPVDINGVGVLTTNRYWIDVSQSTEAWLLLLTSDVAGVPTITFQKATSSAGANEVAAGSPDHQYHIEQTTNAALLTTDNMTKQSSIDLAPASGSGRWGVYYFDLAGFAGIAATSQYTHLTVSLADPGAACIAFGVWMLKLAQANIGCADVVAAAS